MSPYVRVKCVDSRILTYDLTQGVLPYYQTDLADYDPATMGSDITMVKVSFSGQVVVSVDNYQDASRFLEQTFHFNEILGPQSCTRIAHTPLDWAEDLMPAHKLALYPNLACFHGAAHLVNNKVKRWLDQGRVPYDSCIERVRFLPDDRFHPRTYTAFFADVGAHRTHMLGQIVAVLAGYLVAVYENNPAAKRFDRDHVLALVQGPQNVNTTRFPYSGVIDADVTIQTLEDEAVLAGV